MLSWVECNDIEFERMALLRIQVKLIRFRAVGAYLTRLVSNSFLSTPSHTLEYTHTHTHTHTLQYIHTRTHTHSLIHTCPHTPTHTHSKYFTSSPLLPCQMTVLATVWCHTRTLPSWVRTVLLAMLKYGHAKVLFLWNWRNRNLKEADLSSHAPQLWIDMQKRKRDIKGGGEMWSIRRRDRSTVIWINYIAFSNYKGCVQCIDLIWISLCWIGLHWACRQCGGVFKRQSSVIRHVQQGNTTYLSSRY